MKTVGEGFSKVGNKLSLGVTAPLLGINISDTEVKTYALKQGLAELWTHLRIK